VARAPGAPPAPRSRDRSRPCHRAIDWVDGSLAGLELQIVDRTFRPINSQNQPVANGCPC